MLEDWIPTFIFVFIIGLIIGSIINKILDRNRPIKVKCDWCGNEFSMIKKEVKARRKYQGYIFCSGRCRRAEEASRGVKEKRVRWINHE